MKILIITQAVDNRNTTLGFFTGWISAFAKEVPDINVICLYKGDYILPRSVSVYSLGKEQGVSKIGYIKNFFSLIWKLRRSYDVVFVHMNQEYVVLGGIFWKLFGKKILFWRNHPYGNVITRIAVALSDKVFCTADKSYTAQFKKTVRMPAGIDTTLFRDGVVERSKNRLLVFGRIAPVKNIEKVIDAVTLLNAKGLSYSLSVVGDALPRDTQYVDFLKARVHESRMDEYIKFLPGVVFSDGPIVYGMHEVCINVTASGSFDKTVLEALACGTKVLVSNTSMKNYVPEGSFIDINDVEHIALAIERITSMSEQESTTYKDRAVALVNQESLDTLIHTLISYV